MFEVFTTTMVRLISGRLLQGSVSAEKSSSISAISLPRSPQPT